MGGIPVDKTTVVSLRVSAWAQNDRGLENDGNPPFSLPGSVPHLQTSEGSANSGGLPPHLGPPARPGLVLVSSFFDDAVVMFDEVGNLLGTLTNGGPLIGPEGLAFGTNGNLLVVSRETDSVLEYDGENGAFVRTFIDEALDRPNGMIKDAEGNLLIASRGGVLKFDGSSGSLIGVFAEIPGFLIDLAFGPNGNLFVSAPSVDGVVEVDSDTGAVLGVFASGGGLFSTNQLLFGGAAQDLFVGGDSPHAIFRYDGLSGGFLGVFASGFGMKNPGPTLTHPNGNMLVGTGFGNTLLEFDFQTGDFIGTFADEGLNFPTFAIVIPESSGACCNRATGDCRDGVTLAQCSGADEEWAKNEKCNALDPPCRPLSIPTVSEWGVVVLFLLLLVGGIHLLLRQINGVRA